MSHALHLRQTRQSLKLGVRNIHYRGVAQPGSAPALGAGSRRFKSSRPDHNNINKLYSCRATIFECMNALAPPYEPPSGKKLNRLYDTKFQHRNDLNNKAETVEKPKKWNLKTSKCLILLYANTAKMQNLDFFDSLAWSL